jgi:hypothetical protein
MATQPFKKSRVPAIPTWRVFRSWGGHKAFLGIVEGTDRNVALQKAINTFKITDPDHIKRLLVEARD